MVVIMVNWLKGMDMMFKRGDGWRDVENSTSLGIYSTE